MEEDAGKPRRSGSGWLRLGHSVWRFPLVVATGWAVIVALLGSAARVFVDQPDRPSWGEVLAATAGNFAFFFVVGLAVAFVLRLVHRRRSGTEAPGAETPPPTEPEARGVTSWKLGRHFIVPTTAEGRLAIGAAVLGVIVGPALFAAPVLLVLAWRKGDRGLLLVLPLLTTVSLVLFVVAEFTIGHD